MLDQVINRGSLFENDLIFGMAHIFGIAPT